MQTILSFDDGNPLDIALAELLEKYRLPAVFFVPPKNNDGPVMTNRQIYLLSKKFEIGAHTLTHPDLTKISLKQAKKEIEGSKKALEDIIGREITQFCYPRGKFNQQIVSIVEKAGFVSARAANWFHTDFKASDRLRQPTTIQFYKRSAWGHIAHCCKWGNLEGLRFYLKKGCPTSLLDLSKKFLVKAKQENGTFHLWGHSWEIDENNLWKEIEKVFKLLSNEK